MISGNKHKVKIGAPTKEIIIDDIGYECNFGGSPINLELKGKPHTFRLDGDPPSVSIGPKRWDLVVAKLWLTVNNDFTDKFTVPVFADASLQQLPLSTGNPHLVSLQFADGLRTVLINGKPYAVEFNAELPVEVGGKKYTVKFPPLPDGFQFGKMEVTGMVKLGAAAPVHSSHPPVIVPNPPVSVGPAMPMMQSRKLDERDDDRHRRRHDHHRRHKSKPSWHGSTGILLNLSTPIEKH